LYQGAAVEAGFDGTNVPWSSALETVRALEEQDTNGRVCCFEVPGVLLLHSKAMAKAMASPAPTQGRANMARNGARPQPVRRAMSHITIKDSRALPT
jgi:hypothetical protein